ncbi:MAG: PQQ-binding-like beta-propeller repeat protein [Pseudomonadota bacterium]
MSSFLSASRKSAFVAVALLATTAATPEGPSIVASPAFTPAQLQALPTEGWLTNGGNLYNQRYSPLTKINRDNVGKLRAVWRASLRGSGLERKHSGQAQALVHEGTLFIVTGNNDVFAISIDTGEVLWEYNARLDPDNVIVCCGWAARGLAMGDGRIYLGQLDNKVVALDQKTGKVVWSVQSQTHADGGYAITAAPLYYDGMVIQGHAGGDMGSRGVIKAFDARTGKLRWLFHTVPAPGEFGSETWPADSDIWKIGGGAVWSTPAVDPELGLLYFPVANPAPDLNGAVRAGDNLFTSSILALDVHTGEYRWHYQVVHHDIWDYGGSNPVVLFDVNIDGQPRKGLSHAPKSGYVYILDRVTGKPLVGIEEVGVPQNVSQRTSPTQPIPVGDEIMPHSIDAAPEGYELVNEGRTFTPFDETPVVYKQLAGINWPPPSYDPQSHLLFFCANDGMGVLRRGGERFTPPALGTSFAGGSFGRVNTARRGIVAALDVTTQKLAWRKQWPDGCASGSINTAGGLLFMGRGDGRMMAFDSRNGSTLWEFQIDASINAPASTFEYKGVQYVAVFAGGSYFSTGKKGDGVWLFSLNGQMQPLPPIAEVAGTPATGGAAPLVPAGPAAPVLTGNAANGKPVYTKTCVPCHGETGKGGHAEGAVLPDNLTAQTIASVATTGRKDMPAFGTALAPQEIADVAAYVETLLKH